MSFHNLNNSGADDYPPLSALNDFLFCPRRCFFHRIEEIWVENAFTTDGSLAHKRVHKSKDAGELPYRTARGLWLVSHQLRVVGIADIVEFHPDPAGGPDIPFPIEYKRGKRRRWDNDEVQLCAQAICLEEMLRVTVPKGAIFHVKSKRRQQIDFDAALREKTIKASKDLENLLKLTKAPPAMLHSKCKGCSLNGFCLPKLNDTLTEFQRLSLSLFKTDS